MKTLQSTYILLLIFAICGCSVSRWQGAQRGRADARKEIESGVMAMEIWGIGIGPPTAYEKYLSKRGVQIRLVGGCMPSDETIGHAEGFNEVMTEEIKNKLGADILVKAEKANHREP